jgi:hypothetical protein
MFVKNKSVWSFVFGLSWVLFCFFWFLGYYTIGSINEGSGAMHIINPYTGLQPYAWIFFFVEIFVIWVVGFPLALPYYVYWYVFGVDLLKGGALLLWFLLSLLTAVLTIYFLLTFFSRKK